MRFVSRQPSEIDIERDLALQILKTVPFASTLMLSGLVSTLSICPAWADSLTNSLPGLAAQVLVTPQGQAEGVSSSAQTKKLAIETRDPVSGDVVHVDVSSNTLTYDAATNTYSVTDNVYIIIPEKDLELLADKVTFQADSGKMLATGHVYIMTRDNVIGCEASDFDFKSNTSWYTQPRTLTDQIRLRADAGVRNDQWLVLKNGRFIINADTVKNFSQAYQRRGLRIGQGAIFSYYTASRKEDLLSGDMGRLMADSDSNVYHMDATVLQRDAADEDVLKKPVSPRDVARADYASDQSPYALHTRTVTIRRKKDRYDDISLSRVSAEVTAKGHSLGWLPKPSLDFGYQEDERFLTYLGPDIGYQQDYGGFYAGPGWDARVLKGWLRFSPIVSYGGGRRLTGSNGEADSVDSKFGLGILTHYRSPHNKTDFGYSSTMREPIFLMQQDLFGRQQTRLRVGVNQEYYNGFFGVERPRQVAEVTDLETIDLSRNLILRTYVSAGYAKDNFFPNRQRTFFVTPTSGEPVSTARIQLQGQLRTREPLLYMGNFGALGALAQGRLAGYGTGDIYGVFQGGPYLNMVVGPTFTQLRYFYAQEVGETPFVFDTYYRGRNNFQTINTLDLGKHVTIGALHSFNLNQDNARNDLLVDQKFFVTTGSKNLKFTLAYDIVQKRSYFGITLNPDGGDVVMNFDTMNMMQPGYDANTNPIPTSVVAPKHTTQPEG